MTLEAPILADIRLALGQLPGAWMRNNTGVARHCGRWQECAAGLRCPCCGAEVIRRSDLRTVRYGLGVGGADLVGVQPVPVRSLPIDGTVGLFSAFEVKTDRGRPTADQLRWLALVQRWGGLAAVVRSAGEAVAVVQRRGR